MMHGVLFIIYFILFSNEAKKMFTQFVALLISTIEYHIKKCLKYSTTMKNDWKIKN